MSGPRAGTAGTAARQRRGNEQKKGVCVYDPAQPFRARRGKFYTLMCTAAGRELPREAFAQALAQALEQTGRRIVLAFEGPEAVGFADTEVRFPFSECAPVGVIHEFYVREDARGRNVGSAMLVSLTTQFKAAGCVSVQASCARVNLKSQEFLEKRGFVKTRHAFSRPLQG